MDIPVISIETHAHSLGVSLAPASVFEVPIVANNDAQAGFREQYYQEMWDRQDAERRIYERGE